MDISVAQYQSVLTQISGPGLYQLFSLEITPSSTFSAGLTMLMITIFVSIVTVVAQQKTGVDSSSGFFSHGQDKKLKDVSAKLENLVIKSKIDVLAEVFKKHFDCLIASEKHSKVELVFLIDASSSVGADNFNSELQFVRKLMADFSVAYNQTRVAIVTFSSIGQVIREVDLMSEPDLKYDKCSVVHHKVKYTGGGTYTLGAMLEAQDIFSHARPDSKKALFLVTDGFSNGGDPRSVAKALKSDGVTIFTFGIHNGNTAELFNMASTPGEEYSFILDSFDEFVALARRALHRDLAAGEYVPVHDSGLCPSVCIAPARCVCGVRTGQYECLCPPGHYGLGSEDHQPPCLPCPNGTYHDGRVPGDVTMCTPCPDVNHITLRPATGLHDCVCKRGFLTNGSSCEMVRCPTLKVPKHGLFISSSCSNVVNAGCGLRCKVGFSLIGSSVRLCQQDGKWSGKPPKCVMKRCPRLAPPNNGVLSCSPRVNAEEDLPVDAECTFSCHNGSYLVGSSTRTCLPLARWDGLPTTCKPIKCLALPKIPNSKWEPEDCMTNRKLPFGHVCKLVCHQGFEREGPETRECGFKGSWSNKKLISKCLDTMPPELSCPYDITTSTNPNESFASIAWSEPHPTDNSNQTVLLWSDPPVEFPLKLQIGTTYFSYIATDSSYNQAVCQFSVTVLDKEPPVVEDCEFTSLHYVVANETQALWYYPEFSDNSMKNISINISHELDSLPMGTTAVTFTALDQSGNSNYCTVNFTLIDDGCKILPSHVTANCSDTSCILTCEEGFIFISSNTTMEVPYPCMLSPLPECSETQEPNSIIQGGTIALSPTESILCQEINFLNQVKSSLQISLSEMCNNATGKCQFNLEAECEEIVASAEEQSNQILGRKKRSVPRKNVNLHFKVTGGLDEMETLSSLSSNLNLFQNIPQISSKVIYNTTQVVCPEGSVHRRNRCVKCPAGTYWTKGKLECEPCGFGTYQPLQAQNQCLLCPDNTSTRKLHAKHVHACRDICQPGTHGHTRGRDGVRQRGVKPCLSCPVGWFQPEVGALTCIKCANNMTTLRRRSTSPHDCHQYLPPCHSPTSCHNGGTCVSIDDHPSCVCASNYFGPRCEYRRNTCQSQPCLHGGSCNDTLSGHTCTCPAGFSGIHCEIDNDECDSSPCQNGGECTDLAGSFICHCHSGFQGELCEQDMDECVAEPCGEGSTCVDQPAGYTCVCRVGYTGKNCELDPCLNTSLCQHNGACYLSTPDNTTHPSFWCDCEVGYSGRYCEVVDDPCSSSPCLNSGSCVTLSDMTDFQCVCKPGYVGKHCETGISSNFTVFFPSSGTSSYVKVKGPYSTTNEVTVCLWMRTQDQFNYGTMFSYATRLQDNALTLTDYNGFVFYVNGDRVVTDVTANDGTWHHICVEWTSLEGRWAIYKDGVQRDGGVGLANNTQILGNGVFVLGQDQDKVGGGFNAAESFVGYLNQVNIWDFSLGKNRIYQLATHCQAQEEGNIINWGQLWSGIQGKVQVVPSKLCQSCKGLSAPPFATVNISETGSLATYSCEQGYSFISLYTSYEQLTMQRKCHLQGDWDGEPPTCAKKNCGYPGFFSFGWIIGQSYLYMDKIVYNCQPGYRLVGNHDRQCLENGSWSGEVPSCQGGDCPDVHMPVHGMMWGSVDTGYKLEFECKFGYEIEGRDTITCLPNNSWSGDPPKCIPKTCQYLSNVTEVTVVNGPGIYEEGKYRLGSKVQVRCRKGYKTVEEDYVMICTNNGWFPLPSEVPCQLITCPVLDIQNGSAVFDSTVLGSVANITCDVGLVLNGSSQLICLESGNWDSFSSCEPVQCPEILTNHLSLPQSSFGKVAMIQCPGGMVLLAGGLPVKDQEVRWECGADGKWHNLTEAPVDPHILNCVPHAPISCAKPEGPQFGYVVPDSLTTSSYQEGHRLQVQCRQGYTLQGVSFTVCKSDGSWTNNTICTAIDCGPPPQPPLTQVELVSNTTYGSMVKLQCESGMQPYGDMTLRCQSNQHWSRFRGRCLRISCGKPILSEGMLFIGNAYLYQEKLKLICPPGFKLDGSEFIICGKDGKWSNAPTCMKK